MAEEATVAAPWSVSQTFSWIGESTFGRYFHQFKIIHTNGTSFALLGSSVYGLAGQWQVSGCGQLPLYSSIKAGPVKSNARRHSLTLQPNSAAPSSTLRDGSPTCPVPGSLPTDGCCAGCSVGNRSRNVYWRGMPLSRADVYLCACQWMCSATPAASCFDQTAVPALENY